MKHVIRYVIGFVVSVVLTLAAYFLVTGTYVAGGVLIAAIALLALAQFFIQMFCFLHLDEDERPRWKMGAFISMAIVLVIVVGGSIWIMNNLNYHMMPAEEMDAKMMQEKDKGF